ncbi:MAG: YaaR family protein [Clostridiales bacterium]|nr:YaaR family protein [Clostridiales bacterium]
MKIRNLGVAAPDLQSLHGQDRTPAADRPLLFRKRLTELTQEQHRAYMEDLIVQIDEQGGRLTRRADLREFERYRALVRRFLDEVVSNGYAFSRENTFGPKGRQRLFAVVRTVDKKLDEMAASLLRGQADNLSLVEQVDEIRGLIVDLFS